MSGTAQPCALAPPESEDDSRHGPTEFTVFPGFFGKARLLSLYLTLALILQWLSGCYQTEFAAYPDEPSHVVGGLMVRDYIAEGFPLPPLRYAEAYYERYPKVAVGHWPPLFYVAQAGWTFLFGVSRNSILLLMAAIGSSLAFVLARETARIFGTWPGVLAGSVLIAIPEVQREMAQVMPEVLVALFAFLATVQFARYLDMEDWRHSVSFAVLASLCILTKGNGWALALVPPIAIFITGRFRLWLRPALWAAAVLTAALCLPWHIFAARYVRHVWTGGPDNIGYIVLNAGMTGAELIRTTGAIVFAFAAAGVVAVFRTPAISRGASRSFLVCMAALLIAACLFSAGVPLEVEARKLIIALPPLIVMAGLGLACVFRYARARWRRAAPLVVAIPAIAFLLGTFSVPKKPNFGFVGAASVALADPAPSTCLVAADAAGEGAFIAEIAMRDRGRRRVILRGSKQLATSDWNGKEYRPRFKTSEELNRYLNRRRVSVIVLEDLPPSEKRLHHALIEQMLEERPDEWVRAQAPPVAQADRSQQNTQCCGRTRVFRRARGIPAARSENIFSTKP